MIPQNNPNIWKSDIQDWSKVEPESANFYVSQAETRLKETTDTYNLTSTRTENYLTLVTAILTGAIGYVFAGEKPYLQAASAFAILPILITIYCLAKNLTQFIVYTVGDEPKAIFTSEFVDTFSGSQQYLNLVHYTMVTLQFKIDENHKTNKQRIQNNARARLALLTTPLAFLAGAIYQYFCGYQLVWSLSLPG
jgi:hypothetical protein